MSNIENYIEDTELLPAGLIIHNIRNTLEILSGSENETNNNNVNSNSTVIAAADIRIIQTLRDSYINKKVYIYIYI